MSYAARRSKSCWIACLYLAAVATITFGSGACGAIARGAEPARGKPFPPELVDFVPYEKNPVFTAAGPGNWDAKIRERGWILKDADGYRMWYTGFNGTRAGWKSLGLASSKDGLAWTRYPGNPIYDKTWTEDMTVLRRDDTYYMFAEGFRFGRAYVFGGRLADDPQWLTSPDGIHWTRKGSLEFRSAAGGELALDIYGTPAIWLEDGQWYLFYEKRDAGIWLARSKDLRVWTNVDDEPVLSPGPGAYDDKMIAMNQIIKYEGRYYGYYHAMGSAELGKWCTCVAVSDDLRKWTKYTGNPIVKPNKSSGILVHDGEQYRLYTMHDQVDVYFPRKPK
jgi:predicted GH43/DUF377 family glycosyl hydrolase